MHAEHEAVGLVLVVIFGHGEVDLVLDAGAGEREVVLQRVFLAAALTRGWGVLERVAECVGLLGGRRGEFQFESRVERAERYGERVETFGDNPEHFILRSTSSFWTSFSRAWPVSLNEAE